jgi:hypothetical protein
MAGAGSDPYDSTLVRLIDRYQSVTDTIVQLSASPLLLRLPVEARIDSGQGAPLKVEIK